MKNFITRILSGAVYVGLIFCAIYFFDTIPAIFLVFFGLVTLIGVWEASRLTHGDEQNQSKVVKCVDALGALAVFASFFFNEECGHSLASFLPILLYGLVRFTIQLYITNQNPIKSLQQSFFCICYVAIPLGLMSTISFSENSMLLLSIFIFLWLNDSGAYLVGSTIGKHRLFERISPKKSWEGFWGGLAFCIAATWLLQWLNLFPACWSIAAAVGFAIVTSVFATWGDLCESLIKRTLGVKDSGNIMPGHGGILDRIDSLLLVAPATLLYLLIIALF